MNNPLFPRRLCIDGFLSLFVLICSTSPRFVLDSHTKISPLSQSTPTTMSSESHNLSPPLAKKVKHEIELFGDVRVDNYYWLRDDSRKDPQIISHLQQENAYTDTVMSGIYIHTFTRFLFVSWKCFNLKLY